MNYDVTIGLEVHAELNTDTKITVAAKTPSVQKLTPSAVLFAWVCPALCPL